MLNPSIYCVSLYHMYSTMLKKRRFALECLEWMIINENLSQLLYYYEFLTTMGTVPPAKTKTKTFRKLLILEAWKTGKIENTMILANTYSKICPALM